ncbi:hypothetical protein TWF106_004829 [Orbilia oligospora]|uniref:SAC domain-containing protein n=1 Tax=Orbilia oligospora TaxID=2813651 RepID=A0A7C8U5P7_ORBOL|nr:hypothetical protein TWF106_004829 [Orbilia oligospora]
MPGLVRKILILAAVDGLLLLPTGPRSRGQGPTKISYKTGAVNASTDETPVSQAVASGNSFEALGIAGLLSVPSGSWLIAITKRSQVAEVKGRQIFVISDIALIPLHSKSEAEAAIFRVKAKAVKRSSSNAGIEDIDSDDDYDGESILSSDDDVSDDPPRRPNHHRTLSSSIAEDVIGKKGVYGRFAERWFSKRGWQVDRNRLQGLSGKGEIGGESFPMRKMRSRTGSPDSEAAEKAISPALDEQAQESQGERTLTGDSTGADAPTDPDQPIEEPVDSEVIEGVANSLTPKLLRTTKLLLSASRSFYFSYDYDITRSISKQTSATSSEVPLHKNVDTEFFWNRHLLEPFIESGQHHFALPLMQGFVAQQHFQIPNKEGYSRNFLLTLLSRRSINRAGLRYLRRGVDEHGYVANCVETEQLLSDIDKNAEYSFVQIRGSIPLFFQQSPYALKPKPILMHSEPANKSAFQTHFKRMKDRYGEIQAVNLVERHGFEAILTRLNIDPTKLETSLNFMNLLWADNGDAVSKQYSSTAALKGDFTRTKKRNISGALADFGLTLTRFWNNIIGDFFTQAAIDYLLGNVSAQVFVEFEAKMMSGDPAVSVSKVRQNAIETSCRLVIADSNEEMIGGWTLRTPGEENTLRTFPFKEIVLLLTDAALYFCKFDFSMDKVSAFERISLENVKGLQYGAYITSTLTSAQVNEKQNVGLVIRYEPGKDDILRINTRSLTSNVSRQNGDIAAEAAVPPPDAEGQGDTKKPDNVEAPPKEKKKPESDPTHERFLAFKAIPADSSIKSSNRLPSPLSKSAESDEEGLILSICSEIERACKVVNSQLNGSSESGSVPDGSTVEDLVTPFIEKKDIVSVQEAKKSTGLFEQVGYSIRRWVWA